MGFDEFIASRVLTNVEAEPGITAAITSATFTTTTATATLFKIKTAIATICIEIVANIYIKSKNNREKVKKSIAGKLLLSPAVKKTLTSYSKSDHQIEVATAATSEKSYQKNHFCGNNYKSFNKLFRHFWLIFKRTT